MSIDSPARIDEHLPPLVTRRSKPSEEQWAVWEKVREHPENLKFGLTEVRTGIAYYRLGPPEEEFSCEDVVSVGVCGSYDHDFPGPRPDEQTECVLLGINGSSGTRLVNILIHPDEARQLANLLTKAAKTALS